MSRSSTSAKEGLRRDQRLCRRADYLSCYRRGRKRTGSVLILYSQAGATSQARLGITASRKVGSSVVRQKVKRRIREIFRRWPGRSELDPIDLVVHLKSEAGGTSFAQIREDLERLLAALPKSRQKFPAGAISNDRGKTRSAPPPVNDPSAAGIPKHSGAPLAEG